MNCKLCGGLGWLFSLSPRGLCDDCERLVTMEAEQHERMAGESARSADETLNPHSKITHLDMQVEHLSALAKFEEKGIPTVPEAGKRLEMSRQKRDAVILSTARSELRDALKIARDNAALDEKVRLLSQLLLELQEYESRMTEKRPLQIVTSRVRASLSRVRLSQRLEQAEYAEKAGNKTEARNLYIEALAELKGQGPFSLAKAKRQAEIEERLRRLDIGA
ncbi:MAG: hypothetical protein WC728_05560 [Elusimicrobiota bacterium]